MLESHRVINSGRTPPEFRHANLTHYNCVVLTDELPDLDSFDCLFYCLGSIKIKPLARLSLDDFRSDFEMNVMGAVKVIQKYVPQLKKGVNSSILLFSTVVSNLEKPFHASVATSKSGIEGLVKPLGAEFPSTGRVNAMALTVIDTRLASKLLRNEKMIANITERHPIKKILHPEQVASTAAFLLADKAASFLGQIFEMDCGMVSFKI